jgi:hypothetical protein
VPCDTAWLRLSHQVGSHGMTLSHMVRSMELRGFPEAIKSILDQRGWTQSMLGREWDRHQTWVSKTVRGERDTPIGEAARLLARVGYEVVIRPEREKSAPVKRREFHGKIVQLAGGAAAQKVAGVTLIPSAKVPPHQNHAYLATLADHLMRMRGEEGGARLISNVRGHVERVDIAAVISGRDRKLQQAADNLLRAQALTLYDAERINPAESAGKDALALAKASQDAEIQALSYMTLSQVATSAGAGDRGRYYAEEGLKEKEISDRSRANLHKRRMRALATLHDNDAFAAFCDMCDLDERQPGLNLNYGAALRDLGRHAAAIRAFSNSASHYAESSPHFFTQSLHGEIVSLLHTKMPQDAASRIITFAHILPFVNSARLHKDAIEILAASVPWVRVAGMRDAREQLRAVVTATRKST